MRRQPDARYRNRSGLRCQNSFMFKYVFSFYLPDDVGKARQLIYMHVPDYAYSIDGDNLSCVCTCECNSTKAAQIVQELGWASITFSLTCKHR